MATSWYKNYLAADVQPWARQLQKEIDNLKSNFQSAEVNNTTRDDQLASSLRQVQSAANDATDAAADAAVAAQDALDAINGLTGLGSPGSSYPVDGANLVANTVTANEISSGYVYAGQIDADQINAGTIDGLTITGGSVNTSPSSGRNVEISGSSAYFKYLGGYVGEVTTDSVGRLLLSGNGGLYLNGGTSGSTFFGSGGLTIGDAATLSVPGRISSTGTYNATISSAANVFIASNGNLARSTSSLRYKTDVQDIDYGLKALDLRPRTWIDKGQYEENGNSAEGLSRVAGFIAEELDELGFTELVVYDDDGRPEAISYDRIAVAIIPVLKHQQQTIADLTARIEALEG